MNEYRVICDDKEKVKIQANNKDYFESEIENDYVLLSHIPENNGAVINMEIPLDIIETLFIGTLSLKKSKENG